MKSIIRGVLLGLAVSLALAACGDNASKKSASQVAAKVNGSEITVHQINQYLQRSKVSASDSKDAAKQILSHLIDKEVVIQKATEKKLDRDPDVLQQIEAAKKDVLARAYMERVSANAAKPTEAEIGSYYAQHVELFSARRIFTYRVLLTDTVADAQRQELAALSEKASSIDEIVTWLKEKGIKFGVESVTRPAEQMPLQILPKIQQMKEGQLFLLDGKKTIEIVQLVSSKSEPVELASARNSIEAYLMNQRRSEKIQEEIESLRKSAKIEYVGEYQGAVQSAPQAAKPEKESAAASKPSAANDVARSIAAGVK